MKRFIFALFTVLLTTSIALAAWQDTFSNDFEENGATAVANALALEASLVEITDVSITAGIQAEMLVASMCDAGVPFQALQDLLPKLGIGHEAAMIACDISVADRFSGAGYSSTNKKTDYDRPARQKREPASGHDFNR